MLEKIEEKDETMADILTLGELLIDLTQRGRDENGYGAFIAYPGGAPANVAAAASRLGAEAAFIGKVGDDAFGRSLKETLENEGVDTRSIFVCEEHPTTMAIVSVDESGERDFAFYRDPGADTQLTEAEAVGAIDAFFAEADSEEGADKELPLILHVGSLSLTHSPSREACTAAVRAAKKRGMLISYDPNYRAALWDSEEAAAEMMKSLLPYTDILKVSDEELRMLAGTDDLEEGSRLLSSMGSGARGIFLVLVTLGADGVFVRCGDFTETVPGFSVEVADTNGAGDTFLGAMLMQIAANKRSNGGRLVLYRSQLRDMVRYANKAASITCSRSGAIPAMPAYEEVL